MVTIKPAAPIDGAAVLPDDLVDQYVKPAGDQVALLSAFRLTALDWVERHTGRSLTRRRWISRFDGFEMTLRLPRSPVREVVAVSYSGGAGAIDLAPADWRLIGDDMLNPAAGRWPVSAGPVTVVFDAGYDNVSQDAPGLRIAALMMVKHLFDGGSLDDAPATIAMLIDAQYRTPVMA